MTPADILAAVAAVGGTLAVEGRDLRWRAPRGTLSPALVAQLAAHKPALIAAIAGSPEFAPLDPAIAADVAGKWPRAEIVARLDRLAGWAARSGASPLDRQLAADWLAILTAKEGGTTG